MPHTGQADSAALLRTLPLSLLLLQDTPGVRLLAPALGKALFQLWGVLRSEFGNYGGSKKKVLCTMLIPVRCALLWKAAQTAADEECRWNVRWAEPSFQRSPFLTRCLRVGQHPLPHPVRYRHFSPAPLWRFHRQKLHKTLQTPARCRSRPGLSPSRRRCPPARGCLEGGGTT